MGKECSRCDWPKYTLAEIMRCELFYKPGATPPCYQSKKIKSSAGPGIVDFDGRRQKRNATPGKQKDTDPELPDNMSEDLDWPDRSDQ